MKAGDRSRRTKLILGTAVWVSILLLGEAGVRVRERILYGTFARAGTTIYEAKDGVLVLKPGTRVAGTSFGSTANSLRFRGPEVVIPKPRGTFRIVCIGGSTTYDTLARSDDEAWPARLEKLLRARHPNVEVVNAGTPSHSLRHSIGPVVWPNIEKVEPDLIFSYHAANEVTDVARSTFAPRQKYERREEWSAVRLLTDWSLLAYKVWLLADAVTKPEEKEGSGTLPESGPAEFEAALAELVARARARGARLALGTFALRWRADQPPEAKKTLAQGAANVFPGLSLAGIEGAFARYNALIEKAARASGAVLVPIAAELGGHEEYFGDVMHHSAEGSKKMAEVVARALEESKLLGD